MALTDTVTEEIRIAKEKKLFRLAAVEAIKNSHNAVKACWAILFTGGTFALLNSFDHVVECKVGFQSARVPAATGFDCKQLEYLDGLQFLIYLGLIIVYVLTFYRFYVGNIRVFDIRYDEAFKFVQNLATEGSGKADNAAEKDREFKWLFGYSDQWSKAENIYLIFKTLAIIYLTVAITKPLKFEIVYLLVLVLDILWILASTIHFWGIKRVTFRDKFFGSFENKKIRDYEEGKILEKGDNEIIRDLERMFPSRAFKIWGWNNFCSAIVLALFVIPLSLDAVGIQIDAIVIAPLEKCLLVAGLTVMLGNCVIDLWLTWGFYNPRYSKLNDNLF
jgi:hypothetical protein